MKCTAWGILVNNNVISCMVTDGNQTYHGDHFEMYRNIESLCCVPETNIVLQVSYISRTNKLIEKEIRFVVTKGGGGVRGNWMKIVKGYKLPVKR